MCCFDPFLPSSVIVFAYSILVPFCSYYLLHVLSSFQSPLFLTGFSRQYCQSSTLAYHPFPIYQATKFYLFSFFSHFISTALSPSSFMQFQSLFNPKPNNNNNKFSSLLFFLTNPFRILCYFHSIQQICSFFLLSRVQAYYLILRSYSSVCLLCPNPCDLHLHEYGYELSVFFSSIINPTQPNPTSQRSFPIFCSLYALSFLRWAFLYRIITSSLSYIVIVL